MLLRGSQISITSEFRIQQNNQKLRNVNPLFEGKNKRAANGLGPDFFYFGKRKYRDLLEYVNILKYVTREPTFKY